MLAKAGIQETCNYLKKLDSRFHGNDKKIPFRIYYEFVKIRRSNKATMADKTTTEKIKKSITINSTLGILITGMVVSRENKS